MSSIFSLSFSPLLEVWAWPASPPSPPPFFWTRFCSCSGNPSSFPDERLSPFYRPEIACPGEGEFRQWPSWFRIETGERGEANDEGDHEADGGGDGGCWRRRVVHGRTRRGGSGSRPPGSLRGERRIRLQLGLQQHQLDQQRLPELWGGGRGPVQRA